MKRLFTAIGIVLLTPIILFIVLTVLLYVPAVQNYVTKRAAVIASEAVGMDISIGRIALLFPLDLGVEDVVVATTDSITGDSITIADIGRVHVNVKLLPLADGKVVFDALEVEEAKINTADIVAAATIRGEIGSLKVVGREVDLGGNIVTIGDMILEDADVHVALADSVPEDTTTSEPTSWQILIDNVEVHSTALTLTMSDSIAIEANISNLTLTGTDLDLESGRYDVAMLQLIDGSVAYDDIVAADNLMVQIDSLRYCDPAVSLAISSFACRVDYDGAEVDITKIEGQLSMDSTAIHVPSLMLSTTDSQVDATLEMDLNAFDSIPGQLSVRARADIGKQDVLTALAMVGDDLPISTKLYPNYPLSITLSADGNMKHLDITGIEVSLPTAVKASVEGYAENIDDIDHLQARISLDARTENLSFLTGEDFAMPRGITMAGTVTAYGSRYAANVTMREGGGLVTLKGAIDTTPMAYNADIAVNDLNLKHYLIHDSLSTLNLSVAIEGRGTDFLDPRTHVTATAQVDSFAYGSLDFGDIILEASLAEGVAHAEVVSDNALLDGKILIDGLLTRKRIEATLSADIANADLYRLRLVENELGIGVCTHLDVATDLESSHKIEGSIADFSIVTSKATFHPADLNLNACATPDTLWAIVSCGDFDLSLRTSGGYETIIEQIGILGDSVQAQLTERRIDYAAIRPYFPTLDLHLSSGAQNPVAAFLKTQGYSFTDLNADIGTNADEGITGSAHVYTLATDSMQIDTINIRITQDERGVNIFGQVRNNADNPHYVFNTLFKGTFFDNGASIGVQYYDAEDVLGVELGLRAEMCEEGLAVHLFPGTPTLWYKQFALNKDNFISLARTGRVVANVDLLADDGCRVSLLSHDGEEDADSTLLQDITLSIDKFDLGAITSVIPYAPQMTGVIGGDFHVMEDEQRQFTVASYFHADSLTYEGCGIGNVSSDFAYMLREDSTHALSATLLLDDVEVMSLDGTYKNTEEGDIDASLVLAQVPLELINGFVPDQLIGFRGYGVGELAVTGTVAKPIIDGTLNVDSVHVISIPYGVDLRANDAPIRIVSSNLNLKDFALYSYNENPLSINGNVNFADLDRIMLNLRMSAKNYQLINAKEQKGSIAYGKAFVDVGVMVKGTLEQLSIRGMLNVLATTNMTYILTDSPLTADDRLRDLVTFTDFRDTTEVKVYRAAPSGMDMSLTLNIEEGARIFCALNAAKTNYVDVEGGGELRLTWGEDDEMALSGRYTINDGEMKYELPIIPLKTFSIGDGSYIEFTGEMMNPTLNITATEEVKATVSSSDGDSRTVAFDCGVKVTQTLSNMGLEFTLDAPEDLTVKNELAAMSVEDRGKAAVTMLTTGMYISDGNTEGFSMNSALNSFLQSEINSITGSALRSIDLSVGLDSSSDSYGNTHTDYSFKFAKRLWNNRVNFVIGGKISGSESSTENEDDSFIDNVSLEYRLDASSMRYVKVFYDKGAYDLLEGRITEYGAGLIYRKKANTFWQLFNFKSTDK